MTIAAVESIDQILDTIRATPQLKCRNIRINFRRNTTSITLLGSALKSIKGWRFDSALKYTTVKVGNSIILDFYSLTDKELSTCLLENSVNERIRFSSQHNPTIWPSSTISYSKLKLESICQKVNRTPVDISGTVSEQFSYLKHLTVDFKISPIVLNSFRKLEHLEFVNLKDVIDLDIKLPRLKTLRLSGSNIKTLNVAESLNEIAVENCKELKKLNLRGNLQESLKRFFVVNCQKLEIRHKLLCNLRKLSIGNGVYFDESMMNVSFSHLDKLSTLKLFTNGYWPLDLPHTIKSLHLMTTGTKLWLIGRHGSLKLPDSLQTLTIENGVLEPTITPVLHSSDFSSQLQNVKLVNVHVRRGLYLEKLTKTEIINCRFFACKIQIDSRSVFVFSDNFPITKLSNCWYLFYWSQGSLHGKTYPTKRLHNLLGSTAAIRRTNNGAIEVPLSRHAETVEEIFRNVEGVTFGDLKLYDIRVNSDVG